MVEITIHSSIAGMIDGFISMIPVLAQGDSK
jgi:hypothetical protein